MELKHQIAWITIKKTHFRMQTRQRYIETFIKLKFLFDEFEWAFRFFTDNHLAFDIFPFGILDAVFWRKNFFRRHLWNLFFDPTESPRPSFRLCQRQIKLCNSFIIGEWNDI